MEKNEYWTFCSHVLFVHMVLFILRTSLTSFFFVENYFFLCVKLSMVKKRFFSFPHKKFLLGEKGQIKIFRNLCFSCVKPTRTWNCIYFIYFLQVFTDGNCKFEKIIFTPFLTFFYSPDFFFIFWFFFYFLPVFSLKKCSWKLFCLSWKKKICKKNVKTEIKIIFPWCEKLKIPDGIFLFEEKTNSGEFVKKCRRIFFPCVKLWFHV